MVSFWSISMFLVLLKPVSHAEFKYVCLDRKSNTGDVYRGFAMSSKMSFWADFYADFFQSFGDHAN